MVVDVVGSTTIHCGAVNEREMGLLHYRNGAINLVPLEIKHYTVSVRATVFISVPIVHRLT